MKEFKKGDKVMMLRSDGWAKKGWAGTIHKQENVSLVYIDWDNGKKLCHNRRDIALASEIDDPNIAFLMRKKQRR